MAISAGGIGSGLDVNSIIQQLMTVERRPLDLMTKQEKGLSAKLSAYGQVKSALSTFQGAMSNLSTLSKIQVYSAASTNQNVFTATADQTAVQGAYSVVVTQLAQAHKMTSTAAYANSSTTTGATGTLTLTVDQGGAHQASFNVVVNGTNNTLGGIRDAINGATNNVGITATIINVDNGVGGTQSKLALTSNKTGASYAITLADDGAGGNVASTLNMATVAGTGVAQDAKLTIDGLNVSGSTNIIQNAIQGVTVNLLKTQPGVTETLTVSRDIGASKKAIQEFVDAYNALQSTIDSVAGKDKILQGDSGVLTVRSQVQHLLNTAATGLSYGYLADIGITSSATTGQLSIKSSTLDSKLNSDFSGVANLFASNGQGFAFRMKALADSMLGTGGLIVAKQDGLNATLKSVKSREAEFEFRLTSIESRLKKQFGALDSLMGRMNQTSSYLSQQLSRLR